MSHKKKVALILAILCLILLTANSAIRTRTFQQSFYPMGGEVTVIDKFETEDSFFITIKEGGASPSEFDLSCTQEQFDSVEIGDLANCERYESILSHTGIIHNIEPIS